jgi:dolichyl-phosphate-mannose-protein mannosyltransferase
MNGGMRRLGTTALVMVMMAASFALAAPSPTAGNLMLNGNFATGSGNSPDNWRGEAWVNSPAAVEYRWIAPAKGQPGELEVKNLQPNDARWMQSLALQPGWYYISAQVRAENVPTDKTGVNISLLEDGVMSHDLHGTTDWQRVGFYVKIGKHGADVEVGLRVGGFSNLNRGVGFFRNATLEPIAQLPAGATPVFDLDAIRKASAAAPIGQPWTLYATFILLAVVAYLGWRAYGEATIDVVVATPPPPKVKRRAKKRRAHD